MQEQVRSRVSVLLAIVALGVFVTFVFGQPPITATAQSNFVGGQPSRLDSADIRALRLRFEAGARSNWHSHAGWQILAADEGRGRTQERGKPMRELMSGGQPIYAGPGVVHWHGAAPDEHVVQLTFIGGPAGATWFEPVSDDDYHGRWRLT